MSINPDFTLEAKVAVVTGASRGIGRDLAKALAGAGARVAVVSRDAADLADLVRELESDGGDAFAVGLDVRDVSAIEPVFAAIRDRFGSVDILVNNAGVGANHPA